MTGTKPRSYCLADKPFPVGAKAMRQLRLLQLGPMPVEWATATYERLRRGGYATLTAQGTVFITDAGRALLSGPEGRAATRPEPKAAETTTQAAGAGEDGTETIARTG